MKRKTLSAVAISLAAAALVGCTPSSPKPTSLKGKQFSFYAFNVPITTVLYADYDDQTQAKKAEDTVVALKRIFSDVEESLSAVIDSSPIAAFNAAPAGATVMLDETAYSVLTLAKELFLETDGAYNPAVGMSVDLWGFTPRFSEADYEPTEPYDRDVDDDGAFTTLPDEAYVEAFRTLSDFGNVELYRQGNDYYAVKPDCSVVMEGVTYTMRVDLGGIGKGYAVELGEAYLRSQGYEKGYLNAGSSSISLMQSNKESDDYAWNLGIRHPRKEGNYTSKSVKDTQVSSSGDYEKYYVLDGVRYCHVIDPSTGAPIRSNICTATIVGLPAAKADAMTTALLVMGRENAVAFINEKLSDYDVTFVWYHEALDRYEVISTGEVELSDPDFVMGSRMENGKVVLSY
ncbi:MAG: FAD:protein FMN transferase [Christensenellaceae bacterium]